MNSFVNVQVRILAAQAQRQLAALQAQMAGLGGSFGGANRQAGMFGRTLSTMQLSSFGSRIQWIGRQLEYNFTLPVLAAAAASYKLALENEKAFTRVTKVYGDAAQGADFYSKEIQALRRNLVELSNHYGVHQKEVIDIAASWAAAGASGIALAKSVDLTLQTMILGEMKAAEATQALIAIQAQYGLSTAELAKTISILNMVENQTGISLSGLVEGFARAAGVARSAGVDVRHLAAMLAALTPAAGSAAQAGNALKTIFSRLQSPTKETREVLSLMGIEYDSLAWKSANMVDQLLILANSFEGLSDKQKGVVASVVASRWQINKFEILMRELVDANGYYQKALKSTADQTAVYAQMQRELNAVLNSSPRRLQILWTMLQNAAADIITPMIPLLLYMAETIKSLVQWFSNLNPAVQKVVLTLLLFLALLGPLIRIGGAVVIMIAQLGGMFMLLLKPIGLVVAGLWAIVQVPILAALTVMGAGMRLLIPIMLSLGTAMFNAAAFIAGALAAGLTLAFRNAAVIATAGLAMIQRVLIAGAAAAGVAYRAGMSILMAITAGTLSVLLSGWARFWTLLQGLMIAGAAAAGRAYRAAIVGIVAVTRGIIPLLLGFWSRLWAGMVFLTAASFVKMRSLFAGFVVTMRAFSTAAMAALTGPWGVAITLVILLVIAFWNNLKKAWSAIIRGTIQAWNQLPRGIRNALLAVVNVVYAAARAVYKAMQWMNPWARHSPSLVENVTSGMAEIKSQYKGVAGITDVFAKAGTSLEEFGRAVERVKRAAELQKIAEQRKDLAGIAADAIPAFDKLASLLVPLRDLLKQMKPQLDAQAAVVATWKSKLDAANAALAEQEVILKQLETVADGWKQQLDAAQSELDRFASAPIEGMKAMEDAIFANQMQQKALRLEMMKMEQALGPLDKLQGKINAINGEIELLQGEQAQLRQAGAGSDILKYYDDQIDMLDQQHQAIIDQVKPIQDLADQIEELGRQAEQLDLEKSLKFDPLKKQIDDVINSMEEMPFDQILAGVVSNKAEVDRLTEAYNQANNAMLEQKKVVDQLTQARDIIQASYDMEAAQLQRMQDEYSEVEQKIRDIETALQDVSQAAKEAAGSGGGGGMSPGAENFMDAAGGDFPDVGGTGGIGREGGIEDQAAMIDEFTKEMAKKTADMFGMFNFLDPIKKAWNTAWGWVKEQATTVLGPIGSAVMAGFSAMGNPFEGMGSWLDTVREVGSGIQSGLKMIWDLIGPPVVDLAKNAWAGLKSAFATIQPEIEKFRDLVGPMGEALGNIWTILQPILAIVLGLILLVVKALISALAGGIKPFIEGLGALIRGIIQILRGVIEFVVGVFTGDWEMAWNGIKDVFMGIWNGIYGALKGIVLTIWGVIKGLVTGIYDFFVWLWDVLVGHSIVPDMVNGIIAWWNILKDVGTAIFNAIVTAIKWAYENVIKPVFDAWGNALNVLKIVFSAVFSAIQDLWNRMVDRTQWARNAIGSAIDGVKSVWNTLTGAFSSVVNQVGGWIDTFVNRFNSIRNRFSFGGLFDGLISAFKSAVNWIIGKWNGLNFGVGPFSVGTPNIPYLAKGGMIASEAMAVVGEGRKGYPEYVIPTDPMYRKRALGLFAELGQNLGVKSVLDKATMFNAMRNAGGDFSSNGSVRFYARGGILGNGTMRAISRGRGGAMVIAPTANTTVIHFHGDLEFPNVKTGEDVEVFLRNLEALIGGEE